ncbi:MAG: DUF1918 domain-containing protein [Solirubrobacterales bacterium]|nr:DUF1918 domain-containing protein [Solirubrobacterales bacterium]
MTDTRSTADARVGDRLETRGLHGQAARSGEILEVVGEPGHHRYRVRWDDGHESIVFPADGVSVVRAAAPHARR